MGKKDKNALIEDRTLRDPMVQMRRKQKFKEKEQRKEQRQFINQEQQDNYKQSLSSYNKSLQQP